MTMNSRFYISGIDARSTVFNAVSYLNARETFSLNPVSKSPTASSSSFYKTQERQNFLEGFSQFYFGLTWKKLRESSKTNQKTFIPRLKKHFFRIKDPKGNYTITLEIPLGNPYTSEQLKELKTHIQLLNSFAIPPEAKDLKLVKRFIWQGEKNCPKGYGCIKEGNENIIYLPQQEKRFQKLKEILCHELAHNIAFNRNFETDPLWLAIANDFLKLIREIKSTSSEEIFDGAHTLCDTHEVFAEMVEWYYCKPEAFTQQQNSFISRAEDLGSKYQDSVKKIYFFIKYFVFQGRQFNKNTPKEWNDLNLRELSTHFNTQNKILILEAIERDPLLQTQKTKEFLKYLIRLEPDTLVGKKAVQTLAQLNKEISN